LSGALVAHLVLRAEALILDTYHGLLAVEWGTALGLLATNSGVAHRTVTVGSVHGASASIQALAIGGITVNGGQGQSRRSIARARLTVVTWEYL